MESAGRRSSPSSSDESSETSPIEPSSPESTASLDEPLVAYLNGLRVAGEVNEGARSDSDELVSLYLFLLPMDEAEDNGLGILGFVDCPRGFFDDDNNNFVSVKSDLIGGRCGVAGWRLADDMLLLGA
jgi:hypothetical protein